MNALPALAVVAVWLAVGIVWCIGSIGKRRAHRHWEHGMATLQSWQPLPLVPAPRTPIEAAELTEARTG